jgi:predicted  nucleic acid-binding Zn-ribbon protein
MNTAIANAKDALAGVELEQEETRPAIESQRNALRSQLDDALADRNGKAGAVSRPMLGKYDRIRGKRDQAIYPLRGGSCGHCDTAVPLQRRNMMSGTGQIEVCEACGVLLYAADGA